MKIPSAHAAVVQYGTTPPGTSNEQQASRWVERMFSQVARRYDLLNHLLSFNLDRGWRRFLMKQLSPILSNPSARVLDLCCGTGDVMLDFKRIAKAQIVGADFCHPMLTAAAYKLTRRNFPALLVEADAMRMPLEDCTFEAVAISFGFRNLVNYSAGLIELRRVLKPGGRLAILEFSHPPNLLMRLAYSFYSKIFLPVIGTLVSGSRDAYTYLPDSIRRFPKAEQLRSMMENAGFEQTEVHLLTGGVAALHIGSRS